MATETISMKRILYIFLALLLSSCYYDNEEELYPADHCDSENVNFASDISAIISIKCASPGCHVNGGAANGNFETYEGIKSKVDNGSFMNRTIIDKTMPPNSELSLCEIEKLTSWLNKGATNE